MDFVLSHYLLSLPKPFGIGFLRSLILSFHLHIQASLFSKAWPVRPYCIAQKGHNSTFYIFVNAERLTVKILYYIAPYIHIAKAMGFVVGLSTASFDKTKFFAVHSLSQSAKKEPPAFTRKTPKISRLRYFFPRIISATSSIPMRLSAFMQYDIPAFSAAFVSLSRETVPDMKPLCLLTYPLSAIFIIAS